jgi:YD repeat-containing protein
MKKQVEYLQQLFYDLWNDFGSSYLLVKHSDRTQIGRRGFSEEEKKQGLILVFNNKTNTTLEWDDEGNLTCILAFGASKEKVFLHHDDLLGVFSPEAGVQFIRSDMGKETEAPSGSQRESGEDSHVVSLSSYKKRKG